MTRQELNLAIYEGTADRGLCQPRLETWIGDRMRCKTMPDRFEIYDELRCTIRYAASAGGFAKVVVKGMISCGIMLTSVAWKVHSAKSALASSRNTTRIEGTGVTRPDMLTISPSSTSVTAPPSSRLERQIGTAPV